MSVIMLDDYRCDTDCATCRARPARAQGRHYAKNTHTAQHDGQTARPKISWLTLWRARARRRA